MCGIIGYIGDNDVAPILLDGLEKLEYRGYDSAGISVLRDNGIQTIKTKGKIHDLREKTAEEYEGFSSIGIGHTRWATHGKPSDRNSHPHNSQNGKFSVVHNGIIENFSTLKEDLKNEGVVFKSDTDTEVVAQLLGKYYNGDIKTTIMKVLDKIEGAYSLGILCEDCPDEIWAVRNASPLIVGLGENENFIASDITAVLKYTRDIYQLNDGEFCCLKKNSVTVYDPQGNQIDKEIVKVTWSIAAAEKAAISILCSKRLWKSLTLLQIRSLRELMIKTKSFWMIFRLRKSSLKISAEFILSPAALHGM